LEDGEISAAQWARNQTKIMNEFRQAEQYYKQAYTDKEKNITSEEGGEDVGGGE
jgi:hypothetical protein